MSANIDDGDVVSSKENNKCALKLLGIDLGNVSDEDILESVSINVEPSAIQALFYDSFNCFYVLHLSDIKSTCLLVGKTLQISSYRVHCLPLFDCYVIGNVYKSVSNSDLRSIFSGFGNIFEVTNHHVLPKSSTFFHVLSGTREIAFLLPGEDTKVDIPVTVTHPPYAFHVHQLCLMCQGHGHSTMKCPTRGDKDVVNAPCPTATSSTVNQYESLIGNSVVIKQEFDLSVDEEESWKDESTEIQVGRATTTSSDNCNILRNQADPPEFSREILIDNTEKERPKRYQKKYVEIFLDENSQEGKNTQKIEKKSSNKECQTVLKGSSRIDVGKNPGPKASAEKDVQELDTSKCFAQFSPLLKKYALKVHGVLESHEMIDLIQIDARNRRNVISFVSNITTDIKAVLIQMRKVLRKYLRDDAYNSSESRYKRKLTTLIRVLNDFKT